MSNPLPIEREDKMQTNCIIHADSRMALAQLEPESVDLVVTDPPYLVNYQDRDGRKIANDTNPEGVLPVFEQVARVLKPNSYALCFAGWSALPMFSQGWNDAGFRIVGQIIWHKAYASRRGYTQYRHESLYVLAKGNPARPAKPLPSVMDWVYSGNRSHPTEKAVEVIAPLIRCFSKQGDLICDPFAGSGSTLVAASLLGRRYLGFELEAKHCHSARARLAGVERYLSAKVAA